MIRVKEQRFRAINQVNWQNLYHEDTALFLFFIGQKEVVYSLKMLSLPKIVQMVFMHNILALSRHFIPQVAWIFPQQHMFYHQFTANNKLFELK